MNIRRVIAFLRFCLALGVLGHPSTTVGGVESLGSLPGGAPNSLALAVSADGTVVVGDAFGAAGREAFRWTEGGGMVGLGDLEGGDFLSSATDVSADGSVVVGGSAGADGFEAFRWTAAGGMEGLGDFEGGQFSSSASAVSADGSVVVGQGYREGIIEGFRWTSATGLVGIGDLPGGVFQSSAEGVSDDGTTVVGQGYRFQATEAIRWNGGNITGLGLLPAGLAAGSALDANADGTVVVGWAGVNPSGAEEAFRWTAESGMVGLGTLEPDWGRFSRANAVSADGRVVVGESESSAGFFGREAFLWDEAGGMRSLKEELETVYGDELLDWTLLRATGISDDGKVVVGTGYFEPTLTEVAFRAELVPAPVPELATYRWSGPLKSREIAPGQAPIYRNVQMGEDMEGFFTIGITDLGGTFVPPGTYEFPGEEFFGSITGRGITIETALSTRPLEVRFLDNHLPEPGELALFNSCLGTSLPEGTRFDLAEIEVDLSFGIKRLEFGVSLISLDLNWLSGADYREFPSLDEVDLGLYFVVEDRLGEEIYNAVGVLTEFAKEQVDPIVITDVRRSADTVTIEFRSTPSVSTWRIRGTAGLDQPFSEDLTALPGTTIMEEPLVPGTYHAVVDVAGRGGRYFLRVER